MSDTLLLTNAIINYSSRSLLMQIWQNDKRFYITEFIAKWVNNSSKSQHRQIWDNVTRFQITGYFLHNRGLSKL